jgi:DNA-binding XRE family transcriptional regulator
VAVPVAAQDFWDDEKQDEDLTLARSICKSLRLTKASPPPEAGYGSPKSRPICVCCRPTPMTRTT